MTAVAPVVINGNGLWVGWPGIHLEDPNEPIPESDPNDITPTAGLKSKKVSAPLPLKTPEHMSLHVLLPMCHLINPKKTIKKSSTSVHSRFIWLCILFYKNASSYHTCYINRMFSSVPGYRPIAISARRFASIRGRCYFWRKYFGSRW